MTVFVENDIYELKKIKSGLKTEVVLFSGLEGLLKFINLNWEDISTVVMDISVDPEKVPCVANYIKSMFPNITTVEYSDEENFNPVFTYKLCKPFDELGKNLLETLSARH